MWVWRARHHRPVINIIEQERVVDASVSHSLSKTGQTSSQLVIVSDLKINSLRAIIIRILVLKW